MKIVPRESVWDYFAIHPDPEEIQGHLYWFGRQLLRKMRSNGPRKKGAVSPPLYLALTFMRLLEIYGFGWTGVGLEGQRIQFLGDWSKFEPGFRAWNREELAKMLDITPAQMRYFLYNARATGFIDYKSERGPGKRTLWIKLNRERFLNFSQTYDPASDD